MIRTRDSLSSELEAVSEAYHKVLFDIALLAEELDKFRVQVALSASLGVPMIHHTDVTATLDYIANALRKAGQ